MQSGPFLLLYWKCGPDKRRYVVMYCLVSVIACLPGKIKPLRFMLGTDPSMTLIIVCIVQLLERIQWKSVFTSMFSFLFMQPVP